MEELWMAVPITAIAGAFIMIVYLRRYENTERMAMIERGVDPALFTKKKRESSSGTLRAALLFIGAGIGLLIAYFLDRAFNMEEVAYFSMLFIFGGLGLGTAYLVEERKIREEQRKGN
jgi:VIT1/CCC1 family predicted Fe2+/Mn2+ transporter